jgi:hypothetical protein
MLLQQVLIIIPTTATKNRAGRPVQSAWYRARVTNMRAAASPKPLRPLPVRKSGEVPSEPPGERSVSSAAYVLCNERLARFPKRCAVCRGGDPCPDRWGTQLACPCAFPDAPARRFNCATLTFKLLPKEGPTGSGQASGEANVKRVEVQLPKLLPARLTTLQKSCTQAQFSANPAGCPEFSFVGTAIRIDLVGNISITRGLSIFGSKPFPDAPYRNFELNLP